MQRSNSSTRSEEGLDLHDLEEEIATTPGTGTADRRGGDGSDREDSRFGRVGSWFSGRALLLSLAFVAAGAFAGGAVPLFGGVGRLVGIFAAAFAVGAIASRRRYLETALAGAVVLGASFGFSVLSAGVLPVGWHYFQRYGFGFVALGAILGGLLALAGHYFGRDLRDGLTKEL